jgi:hypothetical protein
MCFMWGRNWIFKNFSVEIRVSMASSCTIWYILVNSINNSLSGHKKLDGDNLRCFLPIKFFQRYEDVAKLKNSVILQMTDQSPWIISHKTDLQQWNLREVIPVFCTVPILIISNIHTSVLYTLCVCIFMMRLYIKYRTPSLVAVITRKW